MGTRRRRSIDPPSILLFALLVGGCQHERAADVRQGRSAFSFVQPAGTDWQEDARIKIEPGAAQYRPPIVAGALAIPKYPPAALKAHAGAVTIDVHITIGADGRVSDISPSLVSMALLGRFSQEFENAVDGAIAQWRFQPAIIRHFEQGADGKLPPYLRVSSVETVSAQADVLFKFSDDGGVNLGRLGR